MGREPWTTTGFAPSVLAGEIPAATTVVDTSPEVGSVAGTDGTVAGVTRLVSTTGGSATGTGTSCPDKIDAVSSFGVTVSVMAAVSPGLAAAGIGEGTDPDTSATDTGNGETGTGAGIARLVSGAAFMSFEAESVGGNWTEEVAAEVTRPTGSP
jgi:hypothetical protein